MKSYDERIVKPIAEKLDDFDSVFWEEHVNYERNGFYWADDSSLFSNREANYKTMQKEYFFVFFISV